LISEIHAVTAGLTLSLIFKTRHPRSHSVDMYASATVSAFGLAVTSTF